MTAQAVSLPRIVPGNLRPFDISRDLLPVADLVELCFADSLDADGRLYIKQMRQAARNGPFLELAGGPGSLRDLPMSGYVWQEDDRVVGNLSLIPHRRNGERLYLIANVAVHPDFRKRGIARALTQATMEALERRGQKETWLQVDETNTAAVNLYSSLGFRERLRRTSWRMLPQRELVVGSAAGLELRLRRPSDWSLQKEWLLNNYPTDVRWQLPLDINLLRPGLKGGLTRLFSERQILQWSAVDGNELLGVLSWQSSTLEADRLWLAADNEKEERAIPLLTRHANAMLRQGRILALNYPALRAKETFERSGFQAVRTLIWMDFPWEQK
jgi:ribosomal protein S18 acetylase RimI-like enzyme